MDIRNDRDAILLLKSINAPTRLVVHHILVLQAAQELVKGLQSNFKLNFDSNLVFLGAAIHDCGKAIHPEEITQPGSQHEVAGEKFLLSHDVAPEIARFCRTHATWYDTNTVLEDWLVALADKLWKGQREKALESRVVRYILEETDSSEWEVFMKADSLFEDVAAKGLLRLQQSTSNVTLPK